MKMDPLRFLLSFLEPIGNTAIFYGKERCQLLPSLDTDGLGLEKVFKTRNDAP